MKRVLILVLTFLLVPIAPTWGSSTVQYASADAYLELFMNSGIDCGVVIYSSTLGDWGLPDPKKKDTNSQCSPASEVSEVRFKNSDRVGKRSDTYLDVNTRYFAPDGEGEAPFYRTRKKIQESCSRGGDSRGLQVHLFTKDAKFIVVGNSSLVKAWVDQAVAVVENSLGGLRSCAFLEANPTWGIEAQSIAKKSVPSPKATSKKSVPSPKATSVKSKTKTTIKCQIGGKSYDIIGIDPVCPSSGSASKPTSAPKAQPTTSEADRYAKTGCATFPSAIVRLQNASGSSYNQALLAAQEATFHLIDAAQLDRKYEGLRNAQRIIVEYAQAVGWGGRGYPGDINTVRTAIATFNMGCNSRLSL